MKSFGKYISKQLASFVGVVLLVVFLNALAFGWTFYGIVTKDYGALSPQNMLETVAKASTVNGIAEAAAGQLRNSHVWAIYLDIDGNLTWGVDAPEGLPGHFSIQDVALLARGYLADYPVFIRNTEDGLLLLGYPKDSYMKMLSNYFSLRAVKALPLFAVGMLAVDFAVLFLAYFLSKRKILKSTGPIISAIETLGSGEQTTLAVSDELADVAESVNRASDVLRKQNQARANWISGVSHDIRTPLSIIMGYAEQIARDEEAADPIRQEAESIRQQSVKIKELVQDLNLVSQLEYDMQPVHKFPVRLAGLLRTCAAELLNAGLPERYSVGIDIPPEAEYLVFDCDARLISRAVNNLAQNSIRHNPNGCDIVCSLACTDKAFSLTVSDNGIGLSEEKQAELDRRPHYMESVNDRLDLRHGLGLLLVQQIVEAHKGTMQIKSAAGEGCEVTLVFPK